ncbi:MAG: hypothetical protein LKM30_07070 [Bacilli bacterium]|jgi:hypothetical protein|nr:hypothetical protein [Bacilli bacterium]
MSTAGRLKIRDGSSLASRYWRHNFFRCFRLWPLEILGVLALVFPVLLPLYQKQRYQATRMLTTAEDIVFSKSFDGVDDGQAYFTLALFDFLVLGGFLVSSALVAGLCFGIQELYVGIQYANSTGQESLQLAPVNAFFIPAIVFGVIALACSFLLLEIGGFVASRNPALKLGDLLFDSLATLKKIGGFLFLNDLLYFLGAVLYVALFGAVLLAIVFGMKLASFDGLPAYFFTDYQGLLIAIIILAILLLSVLLLGPRYFLSHRASAYLLLDDTALTGTNTVVLRDAAGSNPSLYQTSPSAATDSQSNGTALKH